MEQIIKVIQKRVEEERQANGFPFLYEIQNNVQSLGDESGLTHIVYFENNRNENANDEPGQENGFYDAINNFYSGILRKVKEEEDGNADFIGWTKLVDNESTLIYTSNDNDLFKVAITDNHLHILLFDSGQH
jgi:hypothetical protein